MANGCRACGEQSTDSFFSLNEVPVHSNLLFSSATESLDLPRGRIELALCPACGFIQNDAFDPALVAYAESYEDSQSNSPHFQRFAGDLVRHLVDAHGLRGKKILEIGCGQGGLLMQLCEAAEAEGLGFDPVYRGPSERPCGKGRVRFVAERYGAGQADLEPDFVFMRHTLEHLSQVGDFLGMLGRNLSEGVPIYIEVPEATRILREVAFWDVYYEHASYFVQGALDRSLRRHGFRPQNLGVGYAGQYLMAEMRRASSEPSCTPTREEMLELQGLCRRFSEAYESLIDQWGERLREWGRSGTAVALWGAGSKSVGFLTGLRQTGEAGPIRAIVDINPAKQGSYQAGTDLPIVAPEALVALQPGVVIVMNSVYRAEICDSLASLGLSVEVLAL